jgi:hypothetical protein
MPQKTVSKVYKELCVKLFGKPVESAVNARIMSYEQDAGLIRAAFRQVYGIDLFRDKLNWFEFVELLQNLPEGNRFEEILGIRSRPIPAPTKYNQKEREWLMKAKQSVALHLTEQEQAKKYDTDAGRVFAGLMGIIKREQKEVTNNGE